MRHRSIVLAVFAAALFADPAATLADPLTDIDVERLEQSTGDDDHEVGEEMRARPMSPASGDA